MPFEEAVAGIAEEAEEIPEEAAEALVEHFAPAETRANIIERRGHEWEVNHNMNEVRNRVIAARIRLHAEIRRFVHRATQLLFDTVREHASLTDHTLADLAKLGHPYSMRWGKDFLHPDYLVHQQSGRLYSSIMQDTGESGQLFYGWVTSQGVYYAPFVEFGTVKMRPRPFMSQAIFEKKDEIMEAADHIMGDFLRISIFTPQP